MKEGGGKGSHRKKGDEDTDMSGATLSATTCSEPFRHTPFRPRGPPLPPTAIPQRARGHPTLPTSTLPTSNWRVMCLSRASSLVASGEMGVLNGSLLGVMRISGWGGITRDGRGGEGGTEQLRGEGGHLTNKAQNTSKEWTKSEHIQDIYFRKVLHTPLLLGSVGSSQNAVVQRNRGRSDKEGNHEAEPKGRRVQKEGGYNIAASRVAGVEGMAEGHPRVCDKNAHPYPPTPKGTSP